MSQGKINLAVLSILSSSLVFGMMAVSDNALVQLCLLVFGGLMTVEVLRSNKEEQR